MNINQKLTELLNTLVDIEKKRRVSQNNLENALENWSIKLKLFQDEASRQSREAAKAKAIQKVEELLARLKKLTTEENDLHQLKESLENKLLIDSNLDEVKNLLIKELESANMKIRWVNDEKKTVYADLDEALRILEDKTKFIEEQKQDIQRLLDEIKSIKIIITQKTEEI